MGIVALSISSHDENSIDPMTESSGIDAASVSDYSYGTEIPEMSTLSPDRLGQDLPKTNPQPGGKEMLHQQTTVGEEVAVSPAEMVRMKASVETE